MRNVTPSLALLIIRYLCLLLGGLVLAARPVQGESLSLVQAYRRAVRTSPSLAIMRERVVQAEATQYRAWNALKPTAAFQASYSRQQEIAVDFLAGISPAVLQQLGISASPIVIQLADQVAWQVVGSVPLFRGPAYPRIAAARAGVEVARLQEIRTRQDFLLRVAQTYYLVVSREDAVMALQNKLDIDRKHLGEARDRVAIGQSPRSESLRADLVVTQDEQNLLAQRNGLKAARRVLAILTGVPGSPSVERPPEVSIPSGNEADMVANAVASRADLRAAETSIRASDRMVQTVWMSFLPVLELTAAYRWNQATGFAGRHGLWNVMLNVTVPIYDAGERYAELRDAQSKRLEAESQREALKVDIATELARLRSDLASATAGVASARKAVRLARTTLDDMETSFRAGAATQLDVLDASQRLLDAELQLTGSLYNRDLSSLALLHARGHFDPLRP